MRTKPRVAAFQALCIAALFASAAVCQIYQLRLTLVGDATVSPTDVRSFSLALASAASVPVSGVMSLRFAHDAVNPVSDDPAVQYISRAVTGTASLGRTVRFDVSAGQTQARFPWSDVVIQAGTVAGTITSFVSDLFAGGSRVSTSASTSLPLSVPRQAPRITGLALVRTASGFDTCVRGYASPREVTGASFSFSPSGQGNLTTTQLTADPNAQFVTWYRGPSSEQYGSMFLYIQSFGVSGPSDAIGSVSVTLRNGLGTSNAISQPFSGFASSCN